MNKKEAQKIALNGKETIMKISGHDRECQNNCAEKAALKALVTAFCNEMSKRLLEKCDQGYFGWDDETFNVDIILTQKMREIAFYERRYTEKQLIDIANFCAFMWNRIDVSLIQERAKDHE